MNLNDQVYYPTVTPRGIVIRVGRVAGLSESHVVIQGTHVIVTRCKEHCFTTLKEARSAYPKISK